MISCMIILIMWYPYGFQKMVEFKEILGRVKNVWYKSNKMLDELMNHMNFSIVIISFYG